MHTFFSCNYQSHLTIITIASAGHISAQKTSEPLNSGPAVRRSIHHPSMRVSELTVLKGKAPEPRLRRQVSHPKFRKATIQHFTFEFPPSKSEQKLVL